MSIELSTWDLSIDKVEVSSLISVCDVHPDDASTLQSRRFQRGPQHAEAKEVGSEVNLLFNVTVNNISVIYVTAHRCAGGLKKFDLRSGFHRHIHLKGFFNVPSEDRQGTTLFIRLFRETALFSRLLRHAGDIVKKEEI